MTLDERIKYFDKTFFQLENVSSRIVKQLIVDEIPEELKDDFMYIIECLNGKHKFGYTYHHVAYNGSELPKTIKGCLINLQKPFLTDNRTNAFVDKTIADSSCYWDFFMPIVNRTRKLGIGSSLIAKTQVSPMLAKKLDALKPNKDTYYITEKLDGNRCIAMFKENAWHFYSRNGKEMNVNFDMIGFDTDRIYDGEVLSREQTEASKRITNYVLLGIVPDKIEGDFNSTSGVINSKATDKDLVYNVFDIVDEDLSYIDRRFILNTMRFEISYNCRVLPVLEVYDTQTELFEKILPLLDKVTKYGAEGLMVNQGSRKYEQKRTDALMKLKKVQTMDMKVIDVFEGSGKYEDMVGALNCYIETSTGERIICNVGSGLTDEQRNDWALHPERIVGQIVEIAYFSISQDANTKGTKTYSLRFPRLKKVRYDKKETSEY